MLGGSKKRNVTERGRLGTRGCLVSFSETESAFGDGRGEGDATSAPDIHLRLKSTDLGKRH